MAAFIPRLTVALLVLVGPALVGASGCFLSRAVPASAEEIASRRVARATGRAATQASRVDELETWVRFNPADCECPEWELWLRGRWVRAVLVAPDEQMLASLRAAGEERQEAKVRSTGDLSTGVDGWPYPVFEWLELSSR